MCISQLLYSYKGRHLTLFHILAIGNSATMNMRIGIGTPLGLVQWKKAS